jgi:hypothetical protein
MEEGAFMSTVIVDPVLCTKLNNLGEELELRDENGRTLGHYLPAASYRKLIYQALHEQISDKEIEELRKQTGGRTVEEIWKSLGRA